MFAILYTLGMFICDLLKSRCRLDAENLFLRHQLNIALSPHSPDDILFFATLTAIQI
jgi:hypothetical protein